MRRNEVAVGASCPPPQDRMIPKNYLQNNHKCNNLVSWKFCEESTRIDWVFCTNKELNRFWNKQEISKTNLGIQIISLLHQKNGKIFITSRKSWLNLPVKKKSLLHISSKTSTNSIAPLSTIHKAFRLVSERNGFPFFIAELKWDSESSIPLSSSKRCHLCFFQFPEQVRSLYCLPLSVSNVLFRNRTRSLMSTVLRNCWMVELFFVR